MSAAAGARRASVIGVLVSGSGTNLQAILDRVAEGWLACRIGVVLSNRDGVRALDRAREAGVPTAVVSHRAHPTREAFEDELSRLLDEARVDLVVLAGFMRVLTPRFIRRWDGRILNIHPALLPAFPGIHAQRQALEHGARVTGCTVHFVDEGTDTGPVLLQAAVPVLPEDDEHSLSARILAQEHRIYPAAIRLVLEGRVVLDGRRVRIGGAPTAEGALVSPALDGLFPEPDRSTDRGPGNPWQA